MIISKTQSSNEVCNMYIDYNVCIYIYNIQAVYLNYEYFREFRQLKNSLIKHLCVFNIFIIQEIP